MWLFVCLFSSAERKYFHHIDISFARISKFSKCELFMLNFVWQDEYSVPSTLECWTYWEVLTFVSQFWRFSNPFSCLETLMALLERPRSMCQGFLRSEDLLKFVFLRRKCKRDKSCIRSGQGSRNSGILASGMGAWLILVTAATTDSGVLYPSRCLFRHSKR